MTQIRRWKVCCEACGRGTLLEHHGPKRIIAISLDWVCLCDKVNHTEV